MDFKVVEVYSRTVPSWVMVFIGLLVNAILVISPIIGDDMLGIK